MAKKKKTLKKLKLKSKLNLRSPYLIIFLILFAAAGSYLMWRALAAQGITLTSADYKSGLSLGATTFPDKDSSKKEFTAIKLNSASTNKAVFINSAVNGGLDSGIYSVCFDAKVVVGGTTGKITATAYNGGATGTAASATYNAPADNKYEPIRPCITNLTLYSSQPGVQVTITNTGGNTIYIEDIGVLKTGSAPSTTSFTPAGMRVLPDPLYGITVDDGLNGASVGDSAMTNINNSAKALTSTNRNRKPITRFIFDENTVPSDYTTAVNEMQPYSYLMGEILDSYYMPSISVSNYTNRTQSFLTAFGNKIDLWEIGNEINGEWLGTTSDVVAKMNGAFGKVKAAGKRTELTFYYNPDCWEKQSNEMFTWINANVNSTLRNGLDYVLLSYYQGDCNNHQISQTEANSVFSKLHSIFPNARLGFGEVGLGNDALVTSSNLSSAQNLLKYYYGLKPSVPNYVTGGFWWHYYQDMLPYNSSSPKPMWKSIDTAFQGY